jgi:hypothetical protein
VTDEEMEAIRLRAYRIWESRGRPEGEHESHWHQALKELGLANPAEQPQGTTLGGTVNDARSLHSPSSTEGRARRSPVAGKILPGLARADLVGLCRHASVAICRSILFANHSAIYLHGFLIRRAWRVVF